MDGKECDRVLNMCLTVVAASAAGGVGLIIIAGCYALARWIVGLGV
jgi:hypothetical protein